MQAVNNVIWCRQLQKWRCRLPLCSSLEALTGLGSTEYAWGWGMVVVSEGEEGRAVAVTLLLLLLVGRKWQDLTCLAEKIQKVPVPASDSFSLGNEAVRSVVYLWQKEKGSYSKCYLCIDLVPTRPFISNPTEGANSISCVVWCSAGLSSVVLCPNCNLHKNPSWFFWFL